MKSIIRNLFCLLLLSVLQPVKGTNTSPWFFSQIGVEDGLSQGSVSCIYQDTDGYLWLGTRGGLHKYDGYEFTIYRNNPTDSCSLKDNNVMAINEDRNKNIWVITDNGLHKIAHQTGKIKRYHVRETRFMHCCIRSHTGDFLVAGEKYIYQFKYKSTGRRRKRESLCGKCTKRTYCS